MAEKRLVWDLWVRINHWALLAAVITSWVTHELGGDRFKYHVWSGYVVLVLVVTRILWGFVGPRHARFASFVRGPGAAIRYARSMFRAPHEVHPGHNPLGGFMVMALLALLLAQAITGLFSNDQIMNTGPLMGYVEQGTSDRVTGFHKKLFDVLLVFIGAHVAAVMYYLFVRRENLVRPMFTGYKPAEWVRPDEAITASRAWLAAIIAAAVALGVAWVVRNAPVASLSYGF